MSDPVFFRFRRALPPTLADIIGWSQAEAQPGVDLSLQIHSIAALDEAGSGALTFAASPADIAALPQTRAAACFVAADHAAHVPPGTAALLTAVPYRDFALTSCAALPRSATAAVGVCQRRREPGRVDPS